MSKSKSLWEYAAELNKSEQNPQQEDTAHIPEMERENKRMQIVIDGIEQRLNPQSPDFDLDAYKEAIKAAGGWDEILKRSKERLQQILKEIETATKENNVDAIEAAAKELPRITVKPTDVINYPLDGLNTDVWNIGVEEVNENGHVRREINTSKKGSLKDCVIVCAFDFNSLPDDVKITKELNQFDKRVYLAAAALYDAGNTSVSATQIFNTMGNSGKPASSDIQKINDSLTKMRVASIYINNAKESQHSDYPLFRYNGSLLPFESKDAIINGKMVGSAIHLFREPPLISFARERKQLTTIHKQLLESPVNKTDENLRIDNYLLIRISRMKSGQAHRKMLFTTIYERCGINTAKKKQRAPEKIRRYLDHYQKCEWIKGYTENKDGITILL